MSWQIFLLINIICGSFVPLLQKLVSKDDKTHPVMAAGFFRIIVAFILLFMAFALPAQSQGANFVGRELNLALMTVLYAAGAVAMMKGIKLIPSSDFAVIMASMTLWSVLGGVIFLNEPLGFSKFMGVLLIVTAVVIVASRASSLPGTEPVQRSLKGYALVIFGAACTGLAFVNDAISLNGNNENFYGFLAFILPTILTFIVFPSSLKSLPRQFSRQNLKINIPLALVFAFGYFGISSAYKAGGQVSVIAPLAQSATLIAIVWGYIFLGERNGLARKIIGAILLVAGAILLNS